MLSLVPFLRNDTLFLVLLRVQVSRVSQKTQMRYNLTGRNPPFVIKISWSLMLILRDTLQAQAECLTTSILSYQDLRYSSVFGLAAAARLGRNSGPRFFTLWVIPSLNMTTVYLISFISDASREKFVAGAPSTRWQYFGYCREIFPCPLPIDTVPWSPSFSAGKSR